MAAAPDRTYNLAGCNSARNRHDRQLASAQGADVWLVRYHPETVLVPVRRGENRGATLPHGHVVRALDRLGRWQGNAQFFTLPPTTDGLRTAVLIQAPHGGPILAAAT